LEVCLLKTDQFTSRNVQFGLDDIVRPVQTNDIRLGMTAQAKCDRLMGLTQAGRDRGVFLSGPEVLGMNADPDAITVRVAATFLAFRLCVAEAFAGVVMVLAVSSHLQSNRNIVVALI